MELSWGKGLPSDLLERWPKTPSGEPEKAVQDEYDEVTKMLKA